MTVGRKTIQNALYMIRDFSYHIRMVFHPFNEKRAGDFWTVLRGEPEYRLNGSKYWLNIAECRLNESVKEVPPVDLQPMALLEAALFLAKEPMSSRRLAQLAGLPEGTRTRQLIRDMNKRYDQEQSAFCIVEVADGFQLRTRPEFAAWLVRLQGIPAAVRLSNPAMETLTVIAYQQPIPRAEVERIRGVQCGDLIRQLLDQDLAKIVGRSEELGRPFLYGTTPKFLRIFGLGSLKDLPALDI
jgi:segregation and condensation protein B